MANIFLGIPTHDGRINVNAAVPIGMAIHPATIQGQVCVAIEQGSVLPFVFNRLWVAAVSNQRPRFDFFAMLHSDVAPENNWLKILLEEIERWNADVVSVVIPEKNSTGLTSTAIDLAPSKPHHPRRLTMHELFAMPTETFSRDDLAKQFELENPGALLVNTGCWIARLGRPWVKQVSFGFEHRLTWNGDAASLEFHGEDWRFSRQVQEHGGTVYATRKVKCLHYGDRPHTNAAAWGVWKFDQEAAG